MATSTVPIACHAYFSEMQASSAFRKPVVTGLGNSFSKVWKDAGYVSLLDNLVLPKWRDVKLGPVNLTLW
jgi:hypothetical protein